MCNNWVYQTSRAVEKCLKRSLCCSHSVSNICTTEFMRLGMSRSYPVTVLQH
jgi:hypothetical protein